MDGVGRGEPVHGVSAQGLERRGGGRSHADRHRALAPAGVIDGHHDRVADARVSPQGGLDGGRIKVDPAADDQIVAAPMHGDAAPRVDGPAVGRDQLTFGHERPADDQRVGVSADAREGQGRAVGHDLRAGLAHAPGLSQRRADGRAALTEHLRRGRAADQERP